MRIVDNRQTKPLAMRRVVTASLVRRALSRQIRHVEPVAHTDFAHRVVDQIERDFGALVPPYALHLPSPETLAACWSILREPAVGVVVPLAAKEAVAAAVSTSNACPYCVDVHTTTLHALARPEAAAAILVDRADEVTDPSLRAVVTWARSTRSPETPTLRERPFPAAAAPEVIGTALGFHYVNRMVNVFVADSPFPGSPSQAVKGGLRRMLAPGVRRMVTRPGAAGRTLEFLSEAPPSDEFGWAKPEPVIATAFTRAAAAFDAAGRRALPDSVRELVTARLSAWHGEDLGISRSWVEDAVVALPESERAAGRFTLLTALASHQADERVVADFRRTNTGHGDAAVIDAAAWASFAAARRIGEWL